MSDASSPRPWWRRISGHPITHLVAAFLVLALVQTFIVRLYQVPSESMNPTLQTGDRILTSRVAYVGTSPATGDVFVFHKPDDWDTPPEHGLLRSVVGWVGDAVGIGPSNHEALVKRVIAGPGQRVECCDERGRVVVDGVPLDEPYVQHDLPFVAGEIDCASSPASDRCFPSLEVPANSYFVLGDNRANSSDSAVVCRGQTMEASCARFVGVDHVVGKVVGIAWPFDRWMAPLGAPS